MTSQSLEFCLSNPDKFDLAMQTTSESSKSKYRNPSTLACIPCRHRHVKCDALIPVCTRCQNAGSNCYYVRSRRGLRPRRVNPTTEVFTPPLTTPTDSDVVSDSAKNLEKLPSIEMDDLPAEWMIADVSIPMDEVVHRFPNAVT